jgi:hypothetical protein
LLCQGLLFVLSYPFVGFIVSLWGNTYSTGMGIGDHFWVLTIFWTFPFFMNNLGYNMRWCKHLTGAEFAVV